MCYVSVYSILHQKSTEIKTFTYLFAEDVNNWPEQFVEAYSCWIMVGYFYFRIYWVEK